MDTPASRKLPFQGVRNFRDFGGYTAGDRRMAQGRFFRSGHHALASDEDLDGLAGMKIAAIIDLRRPEERGRMPSRRAPGFEGTVIENHDDDEGAGRDSWHGFMEEWDLTPDGMRDYHYRYYRRAPTLPRLLDLYSRYFRTIAESEGPIVVHCAAGKDRTGIICALTHKLAGVHDDDIVADFMLTNDPERFNEFGPLWAEEIAKERGRAPSMEAMHVAMGVEPDYLAKAFAVIEDSYGDLDTYFREGLGIDAAMRAKLERRLFD